MRAESSKKSGKSKNKVKEAKNASGTAVCWGSAKLISDSPDIKKGRRPIYKAKHAGEN
jgi:hypothetical protein